MKFKKTLSSIIYNKRYNFIAIFAISAIIVFSLFGSTIYNIARASFGTRGDTSLIHACKNSRGGIALVNSTDSCNQNETQVTWLKDVNAGEGLTITRSSDGATLALLDTNSSTGWTAASETWTYASVDDPTFTFTISGDKTSKYSPGMRVKLTQTTTKYFIITAVSYSSPNTTVTVYGGTDYDLANASITNNYYSTDKAPQGFPLNPEKWTVEVSDTTQRIQNSPTQNTWYNFGSTSIDIPIGVWRTYYVVEPAGVRSDQGTLTTFVTLSTSNNSESDIDFTNTIVGSHASTDTNPAFIGASQTKEKILNLSSKTTYYLITKTDQTGLTALYNQNYVTKMFIRAISAYL